MTSTDLQNLVILAVEKEYPGSRLFRTNTGMAYPVNSFQKALSMLLKGVKPPWLRPVAFGVPGQGDVSGWIPINGLAVCTHIEIKIGADKQRDTQEVFERVLRAVGGIYILARELEQCMVDLKAEIKVVRDRNLTESR